MTKAGLGSQFSGAICANTNWWEGLPADVEDALRAASEAEASWNIDDLENFVDIASKGMVAAATTVTDASDEMRSAGAAGMDNAANILGTLLIVVQVVIICVWRARSSCCLTR